MNEKFRYEFKSFDKSGSGFLNLYYFPKFENFDLEYESGHNALLDPELSQMILKCCSNYSEMEKTHIISENQQVTIKRIELVTKEKIDKWFNKFSDMSRVELINSIADASKQPCSATDYSMLAEMARALFINCAYSASLENAKIKNSDICHLYSKSISEIYKRNN